ncbi:hypothetical protein [Nonomuraea sediminis]|uniref:hypothetical protein n=1 Tax=Nonomuraea sediminis TaxID=2835864 RepID=UPI001BDD08F1|nr:hypothetical protein [Nonomuraea sediminis]
MKPRSVVAAAIVSAAALMVSPAPAQAGPDLPYCKSGFWCAYNWGYGTGPVSEGDWQGDVEFTGIINNGNYDPGQDHIQVVYVYNGSWHSRCLHYNPGPGEWRFEPGIARLRSVTWRGEC